MLHDVVNLTLSLRIKPRLCLLLLRSTCTIHLVELLSQELVVVIIHDLTRTIIWRCSVEIQLIVLVRLPWGRSPICVTWNGACSWSANSLELVS